LEHDDDNYNCSDLELAKTAGSPAFFAPELCIVGELEIGETLPDSTQIISERIFESKKLKNNGNFGQKKFRIRKEDSVLLPASKSNSPKGAHLDIWAIGVTLFCIVFGLIPFTGQTEFELFHAIVKQP
jgi:serine/threonine protein kinase